MAQGLSLDACNAAAGLKDGAATPLRIVPLRAAAETYQDAHERAHQEHDEQNFRDAGGPRRNSTEAEERGDERDDEENHGIMKHVCTSIVPGDSWQLEVKYSPRRICGAVGGRAENA